MGLMKRTLSEKMRRTVVLNIETQDLIWEMILDRWNLLPRNSAGDLDRKDLILLTQNLGLFKEADILISRT